MSLFDRRRECKLVKDMKSRGRVPYSILLSKCNAVNWYKVCSSGGIEPVNIFWLMLSTRNEES